MDVIELEILTVQCIDRRSDPQQSGTEAQCHERTHSGYHYLDIDNAEDHEKFSAILDRIGVDQPGG